MTMRSAVSERSTKRKRRTKIFWEYIPVTHKQPSTPFQDPELILRTGRTKRRNLRPSQPPPLAVLMEQAADDDTEVQPPRQNPKREHSRIPGICPELNAGYSKRENASRPLFDRYNEPRHISERVGISCFTRPRQHILKESSEPTHLCPSPPVSSSQYAHLPKAFHFASNSNKNPKQSSKDGNFTFITNLTSSAPCRSHPPPNPDATILSKAPYVERGNNSCSPKASALLKFEEGSRPDRLGRDIRHEEDQRADTAAVGRTQVYASDGMTIAGTDYSDRGRAPRSGAIHRPADVARTFPSDNAASMSLINYNSDSSVRFHGANSKAQGSLSLGSLDRTSAHVDTRNDIHYPQFSKGSSAQILFHPTAVR